MKRFILFLCVISLISPAYATEGNMRGVWVASIYNLDYPSQPTTDAETLKSEADGILNNAYDMGLNAVFLQVRPAADALYKSDIFPWSKWLTGTNGTAPENGFDPLKYWVEQAHARGIELHAWINPYRITKTSGDYESLSSASPAKLYPAYVVQYTDGNYYFDPGIPEVRKLVVSGAAEIVKNYDVDGIHMDDYFYPGTDFDDSATYEKYGAEFENIEDWRRNNVDLLIQELNEEVHKIDSNIAFGISPSGIWANKSGNSLGSDTNGQQSYYSHYADTRKWALNNWIDYIAPQIYWNIGCQGSDYEILVNWWANTLKNSATKLYIGIADYKTSDVGSDSVWYNGKEVRRQIELNSNNSIVDGEIHYRYKSLITAKGLKDVITSCYEDDTIKVFIDGIRLRFDQEPMIKNNRTLVPMRAIFEALGAKVEWDNDARTVTATKGEIKITLKIGSKEMMVGNTVKQLDTAAQIVNSRTIIPLRAVSEALSAEVEWNGSNRTIMITKS